MTNTPGTAGTTGGTTSKQREWRVTSHVLVQASGVSEALDLAEQQLRDSGAKGTIRLDLLCESTGETERRTVEL